MPLGIVLAQVPPAFLVQGISPGLQRDLPEICEAEPGIPHSGKIDLSVGHPRGGACRRFLIAETSTALARLRERQDWRGEHHESDEANNKATSPHRRPMTQRTPFVRRQ